MTAAEVDVPMERIREFRPLAAPVSVTGTAPMISAGMAANARPTPALTIMEETMTCQTSVLSSSATA